MARGLAYGVAQHLSLNGFGDLFDGAAPAIFVHEEPEDPDHTITVTEIPAGPVGQLDQTHLIQIRVRDADAEVAEETAHDVEGLLHEAQGLLGDGTVSGSVNVAYIRATSPPTPLGRDPSGSAGGRWRFVQTFVVLTKVGFAYI